MRLQGQVGLYECKGCGRIMRMKGELLDYENARGVVEF